MWMIVLNDGETYTHVAGCRAVFVPEQYQGDEMDRYVKEAYNSDRSVDLAITESSNSILTGDIYIPDMVKIEEES